MSDKFGDWTLKDLIRVKKGKPPAPEKDNERTTGK
jgi:hypothetical protein